MRAKITGLFIVIAIIFLLLACSDGQKDKTETVTPPPQGVAVMDITIKGDDMAKNLGNDWGGDIDNGGSSGATIDYLLKYPDGRELKTVILFVGINDLGSGELAETIIPKYVNLYSSFKAEKIFCVGVPPVAGDAPYNSTLWMEIWKLNEAIKVVCRESHYVDTWQITFSAKDGIHPDAAMDALIKDKITALESSAVARTINDERSL